MNCAYFDFDPGSKEIEQFFSWDEFVFAEFLNIEIWEKEL
jgi:hypothetical protein